VKIIQTHQEKDLEITSQSVQFSRKDVQALNSNKKWENLMIGKETIAILKEKKFYNPSKI